MSLWTIYKWPTLIAIASLIGLLSALLADGVWDLLSWITLGGTAWIGGWYALRRRVSRSR